jgi:RNA polymerase sigma-70 factor (ECF subfamily)
MDSSTNLEIRDSLLAVLSRLAYPFREVLILRYIEDLTISEIAALLDVGTSAAKMRLLRAREQFSAAYCELTERSDG